MVSKLTPIVQRRSFIHLNDNELMEPESAEIVGRIPIAGIMADGLAAAPRPTVLVDLGLLEGGFLISFIDFNPYNVQSLYKAKEQYLASISNFCTIRWFLRHSISNKMIRPQENFSFQL